MARAAQRSTLLLVKGLLVMQAIVAASGLSEQDVQYTVGPDFQVRANTTTPRPIIHQQQGLNPANNVTVDPNIDGWLLNVQMRVNGQAGTVMGLMQTALENEQIVKEVSLKGLKIATVELVWFGTTSPSSGDDGGSSPSGISAWMQQHVKIGTCHRRRQRRKLAAQSFRARKMPSLEEGKLPTIIDAKSWQQPTLVTAKSLGSAILAAPEPLPHNNAAPPHSWRWWRPGSSGVAPMPKLAKIKVKAADNSQKMVEEEVCSATAYRSAAGDTLTHKGSAPGTPNRVARIADMV